MSKQTVRLQKWKKNLSSFLFVLPKIAMFIIIYAFPLGMAVFLSFTKWNIFEKPVFIGLKNYIDMWHDFVFLKSLRVTLAYTAMRVPLTILASLLLAVLVNMKIKGRNIFRVAYFIPTVSAVAISAIIWKLLVFHQQLGILNRILKLVHLPPVSWLGSPDLALFSVTLFGIWWDAGFYMIIILGGLQSIPSPYYDAAKIDGAGSWAIFWRITFPLLSPVILVSSVMCTIWAVQLFSEVFLLTKGGPFYSTQSLVYTIYNTGFKYYRMGYGSAISIFLLFLILIFSFLQFKYFRRRVFEY